MGYKDTLALWVSVSPSGKRDIKQFVKCPSALTFSSLLREGGRMFLTVRHSELGILRAAGLPGVKRIFFWQCKNVVIWQCECDDKVNGRVRKRWDDVEFIEFVSNLPHRKRIQPGPFIAVPQKVASVTSV